jgi:predicted AlkP superfamily phosphohydrolase/phosphomutase
VPIIPEHQSWDEALSACYPSTEYRTRPPVTRRMAARLPASARRFAKRMVPGLVSRRATYTLDWVPASRYRSEWAKMRAFALPAMYDGRLRVNLRGREPAGIVDRVDYAATLDELEEVVRACRDPRTDEPVVDDVERPGAADPLALEPSDADLIVVWRRHPCAFLHPELGLVGPAPYRRTGGHTGPYGFAFVAGEGIQAGDGGIRSAFDISPTVAALADMSPPHGIDGTSLLGALA